MIANLKRIAQRLFVAVVQPAARRAAVQPVRALVRLPRVFDLVSLVMQWRDLQLIKGRLVGANAAVKDAYHLHVQEYNAGVTQAKMITTTRRAEYLYEVLATARQISPLDNLLIIGPRNVLELLLAWVHGFAWANIVGIDLYSTNPKIRLMNMEEMTFTDESFSAITSFATISYAQDTSKALREVSRVLKPGGHAVFSITYAPDATEWAESDITGEQIHQFAKSAGLNLFWHTKSSKINSDRQEQTSHVFGYRKPIRDEKHRDPFVV
jgi:hypothetical protein